MQHPLVVLITLTLCRTNSSSIPGRDERYCPLSAEPMKTEVGGHLGMYENGRRTGVTESRREEIREFLTERFAAPQDTDIKVTPVWCGIGILSTASGGLLASSLHS